LVYLKSTNTTVLKLLINMAYYYILPVTRRKRKWYLIWVTQTIGTYQTFFVQIKIHAINYLFLDGLVVIICILYDTSFHIIVHRQFITIIILDRWVYAARNWLTTELLHQFLVVSTRQWQYATYLHNFISLKFVWSCVVIRTNLIALLIWNSITTMRINSLNIAHWSDIKVTTPLYRVIRISCYAFLAENSLNCCTIAIIFV